MKINLFWSFLGVCVFIAIVLVITVKFNLTLDVLTSR